VKKFLNKLKNNFLLRVCKDARGDTVVLIDLSWVVKGFKKFKEKFRGIK